MTADPLLPEDEERLRTLLANSKRPPGTRYGAVPAPEDDAFAIGDTRVWIGAVDSAEGIRSSCWTFLKLADAQEMAAAREALPGLLASIDQLRRVLDDVRTWQEKVITNRDDVVTHMVKRAEEVRDAAIERADLAEKRLALVGQMANDAVFNHEGVAGNLLGKIAQRTCAMCGGDGVVDAPGTSIGEAPCSECWKRATHLGMSFMDYIGLGRVR